MWERGRGQEYLWIESFGVHPDQIENMGDRQSNDLVGTRCARFIRYVPSLVSLGQNASWRIMNRYVPKYQSTMQPRYKRGAKGAELPRWAIVAIEGSTYAVQQYSAEAGPVYATTGFKQP